MMRRAGIALLVVASLAATSCDGMEEPPPEGHHLLLTFTSIDPSVIERVRITFDVMSAGEGFMMIEPMSYADGAIDVMVEPDGRFVMTIDGAHVAALAEQQGTTTTYVYDLEVYSNDETMRASPPFVTVTVSRAREAIGSASRFLPAWPLPLGQSTEIMIPCSPATLDRCTP